MPTINWLHLTDLHLGAKGVTDFWPNVEETFFDDVAHLVRVAGPLDLVLFTGDLTQSGTPAEFGELERLLARLWARFRVLGSDPRLFAVPGNHDLVRPGRAADPVLLSLLDLWHRDEVQEALLGDPNSAYRQLVAEAFSPYMSWWRATSTPKVGAASEGAVPGDLAATFEKDGLRLGLVGLNSAFLQLAGGDREGKLALHVRQFHAACGGHGPDWARTHDACVLLTHHPATWLTEEARHHLEEEIHAPPERFALHLFGHMHETDYTSWRMAGAAPRNRLQGCSLYSQQAWGKGKHERRHGYALCQLRVEDNAAQLRIWPREVRLVPHVGWRMDRHIPGVLRRDDGGTEPWPITLLRRVQPPPPSNERVEVIAALTKALAELNNIHDDIPSLGINTSQRLWDQWMNDILKPITKNLNEKENRILLNIPSLGPIGSRLTRIEKTCEMMMINIKELLSVIDKKRK